MRNFVDTFPYCRTKWTLNSVEAAGRIFWGIAFTLAILKSIKTGIVSKHFGPIILSIRIMLKDVLMFLITFLVIMAAFSCGVSYMFNYLSNSARASGSSTEGIFTYFFWVLLQVRRRCLLWVVLCC